MSSQTGVPHPPPGVEHGPASTPRDRGRSWLLLLAVCLFVAVAHTAMTWGHVREFWGDTGRWMHEVDRFASGERLYLDFTWPFPPFAMWVVGTLARVVGTDVGQLWLITSVIFLLVVLAFLRYVRLVVPRDLMVVTAITGLVGAMAWAQTSGAPLPLGSYSPAALVGGGLLLVTVGFLVQVVQGTGGWWSCAGLGAAASLAVLTKQDFWMPAFVAVLVGLRHAPARRRGVLVAAAILPALVGYSVVLLRLGPDGFLAMLGGFGHLSERGGRGLPSGRLLAGELGALSIPLWLVPLLGHRRGDRWWLLPATLSLGAILAYWSVLGLSGLAVLAADIPPRAISLFLPFAGLVWLHLARPPAEPRLRGLASVMLIVACAARARRGFEGLEWFQVMLEVPAYALALRAVHGPGRARLQQVAVALLLLVALQVFWTSGRGPLTQREQLGHETVLTPRGPILLVPTAAGDYRFAAATVAELDPGGNRPVFAFGYAGGWAYFLKRRNPTPAPQGFWFTLEPPEQVLAEAQASHPIVFDSRPFREGQVRDTGAGLFRWEAPMIASVYMRHDRPYFERLIAGCPLAARHPATAERPFLEAYDCRE